MNHIIRAGIPYGPEGNEITLLALCSSEYSRLSSVTDDEADSGTSDDSVERGLAFGEFHTKMRLFEVLTHLASQLPTNPTLTKATDFYSRSGPTMRSTIKLLNLIDQADLSISVL